MSLAASITTVILIASCVALTVFTASIVGLGRKRSIAQLDMQLSTIADIIGQNSTAALEFGDKRAGAEVLQGLKKEPHIISACLYDTSWSLFSEYLRAGDGIACPSALGQKAQSSRGYREVIRPAMRGDETVGTIYLLSDTRDISAQEKELIFISLLLAALSLAASGIAGLFLQYRISKPISRLARAIQKVTAEEGFDAWVKVSGSREIAELETGFNSMLTELQRRNYLARLADARLQEQARTDSLTGLPNRRLFMECLLRAMEAARRDRKLLGLLYIDLDGFKLVNDSLGHSIGDLLLRDVAMRLSFRVRKSDTLARIGGDEFAIILTNLNLKEDAAAVAHSLLESMASSFHVEGHEITIGASIGISIFDNSDQDSADLLRQADSAMYSAKRKGRNQAVYFSEDLGLLARERLTLENQLRGAIGRNEINVDYQPEFDPFTGAIVRFEALARWSHPQLGEVSPDRFIPVAEESGIIHALGKYIMEKACFEAVKWQRSGRPIQVAVNVSPIQFNSESLVQDIDRILKRTSLNPERLQIELTESVMMGSLSRSIEKMQSLRALGVNLALDDFGTGYSCLSYLPELPFTAIKLDRSFIARLSHGSEANQMIQSMVDLAHSMGMRVIAEGVEQIEQLELVKALGVDEVQGFLLGQPDPNPSRLLKRAAELPISTRAHSPEPTLQ
jgi:diguanylate cyclase (GGDEF)-like protein